MNISTTFDVLKNGSLIARCGCLSEALSECRERGYLSTEGIEIHKTYHDSTITRVIAVYNVYGEVI